MYKKTKKFKKQEITNLDAKFQKNLKNPKLNIKFQKIKL